MGQNKVSSKKPSRPSKTAAKRNGAHPLGPGAQLLQKVLDLMSTGKAPSKAEATGLIHTFADFIEQDPAAAAFIMRQAAAAVTMGISIQ